MTTRVRWIGILILLATVLGCFGFLVVRFFRVASPATVVPTPVVLEPRPPEVVKTSGLESAKVSGTTFVHPPFGEGDCGACHATTMTDDPPRLSKDLWADELEVCLSCHLLELTGDQLRPVQHDPFSEGTCSDCHDPHAADIPALLRFPQPNLCAQCHEEEEGIAHAPHVRDNPDNCLTCHLPHSSFAEHLLPKRTSRLCLDCHETIVPVVDHPERHDKVALEKACVACHDPHEGSVKDVAQGQACRDCHREDIGLTTAVSSHNGIREGRCDTCHLFHDAPELVAIRQEGFTLRQQVPDACLTCHPDVRKETALPVVHKPLVEPKTEKVCDACHQTHAAPAPHLLNAAGPALCNECHKNVSPHAVGVLSPQAGQANTECRTCHAAHGSVQAHLLNRPITQTCTTCHQDEVASFARDPHRGEVKGDCLGCHTVHRPPEQPVVASATCAECHAEEQTRLVSTGHADLKGGCVACHNRHANGSLKPTDADNGCTACHQDVRHGTHPTRADDAKRDPRTGQPLTCLSCHDPHGTEQPMLVRGSGDGFCLQCHENIKPAQPAPAALADSPHGTYSATTQTCTTCHDLRDAPQLVRAADAACVDCHQTPKAHAGEPCSTCHEPHARTTNRALIRQTIAGIPVRFLRTTGLDSFVDLDGQTDDLCTACHTQTAVNNRVMRTAPHHEGEDCRKCHPHKAGFAPASQSCDVCHGMPPASGAHQAHMNWSDAARVTDCAACHPAVSVWNQPGHRDGTVQMADGRTLADTDVCTACHGNTAVQAKSAWKTGAALTNCLGCHNSQNPARIAGVTAPAVDTHWQENGHGAAGIGLACTLCHDPTARHITGRLGDDTRLKVQGDALCLDCHDGSKATAVSSHGNRTWSKATQPAFSVACVECHNPHGSPNLSMVRERVRGDRVVFLRRTGADSFDEPDDTNADDLCATCHTTTAHNRQPANRATHPHYEGALCTTCHTHDADGTPTTADAFMPTGTCTGCHNRPQDNGDGVPAGGRRAVVDEFGKRTHHGAADDKTCTVCHDFTTHMSGQLALLLPDSGGVIRGTFADDMDLTSFCQGCHDADGATATFAVGGSPFDPFADGSDLRRWAGLAFSVHSNEDHIIAKMEEPFTVGCQECHAAHGSDNRSLIKEQIAGQPITFLALTGTNSFAMRDQGLCAACHTDMVSHRGGVHVPQNKDFSGTNCTTCHAHDRDNNPATLDGFAIGCGTRCHGQPPPAAAAGYPLDENQTPHRAHVGVLGRTAGDLCRTCHKTTMDTNQGHATEPRTFQDVVFDELNPNATYDPATRTCANTTCHSNGAPRGQPLVSQPITWQTVGGLGCNGCHGDAQSLDTNAHRAHLASPYGNRGATSITCATCHAATAADNTTIADPTKHPNGRKDVAVDERALWGDPGQVAYDPGAATCANSRCHSDGAASRETPAAPTFFTPEWDRPLTGTCGTCHGVTAQSLTTGAHPKHLAFLGGGPAQGCTACHPAESEPTHVDGRVEFAEGKTLSQTTVCDTCHSPGGPFNGVAEAKANWPAGAPVSCEGCHDAQPAVVNGVPAPDVVGDNATYGFYVTGHRWADIRCTTCHEPLPVQQHVDGDPRTYRAGRDNYNAAYGLKLGGLNVPRAAEEMYGRNDAALCYACHEEASIVGLPPGYSNALFTHSDPPPPGYPLGPGARLTLFRNEREEGLNFDNVPANGHWDHLDMNWIVWDSDGDGAWDSKPNCSACHDVHGARTVDERGPRPAQTLADMGLVYGEDPELGAYGEVTRTDYLARCRTCHEVPGIRYYRAVR